MITITNEKIYISKFSLKHTKASDVDVKEINPNELIKYLGEEVEFGEDTTFERLFDLIIINKDFLNTLFSMEMGGCLIDDFISDYENKFDAIISDENYTLRISWMIELWEYNDEIDYVDYAFFGGFGKLNEQTDEEEYAIKLDLIPIHEFRGKVIEIDNNFDIQDFEKIEDKLFEPNKSKYKSFSLYEIISSILIEISEFGKPEERDIKRKEMEHLFIDSEEEYSRLISDATKKDINSMIEGDFKDDDTTTFWDLLYPKDKPTGSSSQEIVDNTIIALSIGSDISLEDQLKEAVENDEYEKAAKLKGLIEKRDSKK